MNSLFTGLLALAALPAHAQDNAKPDVVLVVWDATRADHLTPYGYSRDTTPNLAKIAKGGTVFENAVSAAPWTVPSVASIFTGLFVHNHGVDAAATDFTLDLPEASITIAEALKGAGYRTALWSTQGIYTKQKGFTDGFDKVGNPGDDKIVDAALDFAKANKGTPTFQIVYFLNPHSPYTPAKEHDLWTDPAGPDINLRGCPKDASRFPETWICHGEINYGKVTLSDVQWKQLQAKYDGELHQNDAELGRLWAGLGELGKQDSTLFLFTSDHGEAFNDNEREKVWHRLPYESILHVPLIARFPGTFQAGRHAGAVRTVDILPTVLAATGTPLPYGVNGLPLQEAADPRPAAGASHFAGAPQYFRGAGYKLITSRRGPDWVELYDLKKDPTEQNNLATQMPKLVEALTQKRASFIEESKVELSGGGGEATDEELERLRALGYID